MKTLRSKAITTVWSCSTCSTEVCDHVQLYVNRLESELSALRVAQIKAEMEVT